MPGDHQPRGQDRRNHGAIEKRLTELPINFSRRRIKREDAMRRRREDQLGATTVGLVGTWS